MKYDSLPPRDTLVHAWVFLDLSTLWLDEVSTCLLMDRVGFGFE